MEALEVRYAELQGKYRVCHKELKAYDMDNLKRRRKESFEKNIATNGWWLACLADYYKNRYSQLKKIKKRDNCMCQKNFKTLANINNY